MSAVYPGDVSWGDHFTIDEVVEATGFDRRTIAYYVQEGLLPKVGRRGRLTRYPRNVVDRLLFIKLLREAEESGARPVPMTLAEIRDALERIPAKRLFAVVRGALPLSSLDPYLNPPGGTPSEAAASGPPPERWKARLEAPPDLAPRALRRDLMLEETGEPDLFVPRKSSGAPRRESRLEVAESRSRYSDDELGISACEGPPTELFDAPNRLGPPDDDLEALLTDLCRLTAHRPPDRGAAESWTRVAITPGLELAARGGDHRVHSLLDRIATLLRRRLGGSPGGR